MSNEPKRHPGQVASPSRPVVQLVHEQAVGQAEYDAAVEAVQWCREWILRDLAEIERRLHDMRFSRNRGDVA